MSVHVSPIEDAIAHELHHECPCGPCVQFVDPDTAATYPSGPLVIHHSADGREHTGKRPEGAGWLTTEVDR